MVEQKIIIPVLERSDAFRLERYEKPINKQSLRDDVTSYLGEYRFALPKYSYNLVFENGYLLDPKKKVSLEDMAHKSLGARILEGKSTYREIAEKQGIQALDRKLANAKKGDTIIWMSPPGDKKEGYGDYGFVFYGKVGEGKFKKDITMTAIRVNSEDLNGYSKAFQIMTGAKYSFLTAEKAIEDPQVLGGNLPEGYIDSVLGLTLGFRDRGKEKNRFENVMIALNPLIEDFIDSPSKKGLNSIENYALYLKDIYESNTSDKRVSLADFKHLIKLEDLKMFNFEPPKVAGSCGSTGKDSSITSSNIFNKLSGLNSLLSDSEQEWFHCPKCDYQADGPIGDTCPGCKLTKEEYGKETGVSCD